MKQSMFAFLLLAGCGGPAKEAPVRIVALHSAHPHMPAALADSLGYFKEEGMAVTFEMLATSAKAAEALIAGSTDVITGIYEQTLQLAAEGRSLRSFVLVSGDVRALVALPRSGIRSLRDLKGRTLGVPGPGGANHLFANYVLTRHGMHPVDINVAAIGLGQSSVAAMERGIVDAGSIGGNDLFYLKIKHPGLNILADTSTPEGSMAVYGSKQFPTCVLLARSEWLEQHPDKARKIARAMKRALQWLQAHSPEQIRERVPEAYRMSDRDVEVESLRLMKTIWSKDGVMPLDGPETVRRVMAVTNEKIRDGKIDLSKTYTNEFVKEVR